MSSGTLVPSADRRAHTRTDTSLVAHMVDRRRLHAPETCNPTCRHRTNTRCSCTVYNCTVRADRCCTALLHRVARRGVCPAARTPVGALPNRIVSQARNGRQGRAANATMACIVSLQVSFLCCCIFFFCDVLTTKGGPSSNPPLDSPLLFPTQLRSSTLIGRLLGGGLGV